MPKKQLCDTCSVEGCNRDAVCKNLCMLHYGRAKNPPKTKTRASRPSLLAKYADEWRVLNSMRSRCSRPSDPSYKNYGAKGIKVCDRWQGKDGLKNFIADMGPRPKGYTPGGRALYSIDRIDPNGDYTPENCRWATIWEQNQHTSRNSRHVGVYHLKDGSWRAELTVNKKTYQKQFKDKDSAIQYRKFLVDTYL